MNDKCFGESVSEWMSELNYCSYYLHKVIWCIYSKEMGSLYYQKLRTLSNMSSKFCKIVSFCMFKNAFMLFMLPDFAYRARKRKHFLFEKHEKLSISCKHDLQLWIILYGVYNSSCKSKIIFDNSEPLRTTKVVKKVVEKNSIPL